MRHSRNSLTRALGVAGASLIVVACVDETPGLSLDSTPRNEASDAGPDAHDIVHGSDADTTADAHAEGGDPGERIDASVDDAETDARGGQSAEAGIGAACVFHSEPVADPPPPPDAGVVFPPEPPDGGAIPDVTIGTSPFLGAFLADHWGRPLYVYGADLPGDCDAAPVTQCTDDCALAWPPFNAGPRSLAAGLDAADFGTIARADGTHQTTYRGWPLYRYKKDLGTDITGQGKGKTWFAAELTLPNVLVMRSPVEAGGVKYLADDTGRTLYAFGSDTKGAAGSPPVSACVDACLDAFRPFSANPVVPVTVLEPTDLAGFVRPDGIWQVTYRGAPLYYALSDHRSGDRSGADGANWSLVEP